MSLATLIRRMSEAGAPPEAIALAIEEIEAMQELLDSRRVSDRDRKRAQREAQKSANVTGQSEDCPETILGQSGTTPFPLDGPPKVSPTPPSNNPPLIPQPTAPPRPCLLKGIGLPQVIPAEPWLAFVRMRKAIPKVPFTEDAARGAVRKVLKLAGEGYDPAKLLWRAVDQGWRTVFANDDCKITILPIQRDAAWHEDQARFYEKIGKADDAAEHRRRATSIGKIASDIAREVRA